MLVKKVESFQTEIVITYKIFGMTIYKKIMPISNRNIDYGLITML